MAFPDLTGMLNINNVTNQNDPQSIRCRVFIGNLNTMQMTKQELEQTFSKYGFISGVSMHKGFAFVQFTNEINARLASLGEDQKVYYNMRVDVNIASEPKARRRARNDGNLQGNNGNVKRNRIEGSTRGSSNSSNASVTATGARLSNLVSLVNPTFPNTGNSENADKVLSSHGSTSIPVGTSHTQPILSSTSNTILERSSNISHSMKSVHSASGSTHHDSQNIGSSTALLKRNIFGKEVKDFLVCGVCKAAFEHVNKLIEHKSEGCRLRFACRCKQLDEPTVLQCAYCLAEVSSAWELIKHCQAEHELTIYALGPSNSPSESLSSRDQSHAAENSDVSMEHVRPSSKRHEFLEVKMETNSSTSDNPSFQSSLIDLDEHKSMGSPKYSGSSANAVGRSNRNHKEGASETSVKKSVSTDEDTTQSRQSGTRIGRSSSRRRRGDIDGSDDDESDDEDHQ